MRIRRQLKGIGSETTFVLDVVERVDVDIRIAFELWRLGDLPRFAVRYRNQLIFVLVQILRARIPLRAQRQKAYAFLGARERAIGRMRARKMHGVERQRMFADDATATDDHLKLIDFVKVWLDHTMRRAFSQKRHWLLHAFGWAHEIGTPGGATTRWVA